MNPAQHFQDLTLTPEQQDAFLARIAPQVSPEDHQIIEAMTRGVPQLLELIEQDPMTLRKLRLMIFDPKTEKTSRVCPSAEPAVLEKPKGKRRGHGRNKAKNYTGARWVSVPHPDLKAGDRCPQCPKRKGTFTTSLLAYAQNHRVALYFTGWRHAGENLAQVLEHRAAGLEPPIQMCDALSRNMSLEFETILAHCLSHGRREFVSVAQNFPEECRHVLQSLGEVYRVDAQAKELKLSPDQRLVHHQTHSQPVMESLQTWMRDQIDGERVEPNSGLGQAIAYMLKNWEPLTLFLRAAGAPLDNNICEQALKRAILHRKNSLSYKTLKGARTGDLFMSLIHTCRLNQVNPFDYLMAIARNGDAIGMAPENWLPWNYPKTPACTIDTG